jgi:hypothetical protein
MCWQGSSSRRERKALMFRWLIHLFTRKSIRKVPAWETPPEIRKKLRCAMVGIDPDTVRERPLTPTATRS